VARPDSMEPHPLAVFAKQVPVAVPEKAARSALNFIQALWQRVPPEAAQAPEYRPDGKACPCVQPSTWGDFHWQPGLPTARFNMFSSMPLACMSISTWRPQLATPSKTVFQKS